MRIFWLRFRILYYFSSFVLLKYKIQMCPFSAKSKITLVYIAFLFMYKPVIIIYSLTAGPCTRKQYRKFGGPMRISFFLNTSIPEAEFFYLIGTKVLSFLPCYSQSSLISTDGSPPPPSKSRLKLSPYF